MAHLTDEQKADMKAAKEAELANLVLLYEPTDNEKDAMELIGTFGKRDEYLAKGFRQQIKSAISGQIQKNLREQSNAKRKGNHQDAAKYDVVLDALYAADNKL
jgi:hypothetical protein